MITQSAKKAYRQNLRRRAQNVQRKSALKKVLKNYKNLVTAKNLEAAKNELPKVYKALDKAAKVNLIKDNKASRLKSRLTKLVTSLPAGRQVAHH
ncbi:MAG: 30S ribosomal protein S20 [Candidatus Harrisonbacteria bacterium]|nr:30S ribosomal protein S20 [Candidatus Harrisonbacteria bacterium]